MAIRFLLSRYLRRLLDLVVGRPIAACLGLAGGVLVGTGILVTMAGTIGTSPADAAATAAYRPDVESLLDTRSPGGRRYGWLLGTKPDRVANGPVERVLSSVRERPAAAPEAPGVAVPLGALGTPFGIAPDAVPTALSDLAPLGSAGPGLSGGAPIVGGVLPGVGGGGGGGTGGGDNPVTTTPDAPASPVPEPSVWAMLILGLALVGGVWRRAPRARGSALAVGLR